MSASDLAHLIRSPLLRLPREKQRSRRGPLSQRNFPRHAAETRSPGALIQLYRASESQQGDGTRATPSHFPGRPSISIIHLFAASPIDRAPAITNGDAREEMRERTGRDADDVRTHASPPFGRAELRRRAASLDGNVGTRSIERDVETEGMPPTYYVNGARIARTGANKSPGEDCFRRGSSS